MKTMKKQMIALSLTAMLVMMSVVPALAQAEDPSKEPTVSVTIEGGDRHLTAQDSIGFSGHTLNGVAQNLDSETAIDTPWVVEDFTGTGAGWKVIIDAKDFVTEGPTVRTIAVTNFKVKVGSILPVEHDGQGRFAPPTTGLADYAALGTGASAVTLLTAAVDTGMQAYTFAPLFRLEVPADVYAGEYTSEVVITMTAGPN